MTPEMYHAFGYRVLKSVFERVSPNPGDNRYQHSDSAMGHLIPQLADFNLTGCNFGPTVTVEEIRLVYWLEGYTENGGVSEDTAVPYWCIEYNGGNSIHIAAYEE